MTVTYHLTAPHKLEAVWLTAYLVPFCDNKTQNCMTETNKKIKSIFDEARETLLITIPWAFRNEEKKAHPMTLVNLFIRFPNVKKCVSTRFSQDQTDILEPLIRFLQTHYPKKLQHVSVCEVERGSYKNARSDKPAQLTQALLNAFSHAGTLTLKIRSGKDFVNGEMINSALQKSKELTTFNFNGRDLSSSFALEADFALCPKLRAINLKEISKLNAATIHTLGQCPDLTELSIGHAWKSARELEQFLGTNHGLKLKQLVLEDMPCFLDDETLNQATQNLNDLEFFSRLCSSPQPCVTDKGLVQLGAHCTRLRTLMFNINEITDEGITHFAMRAPQLEKLSTICMYRLTSQGMCALTEHCPLLKALELVHFSDITPEFLMALSKNCKKLQFLYISNGRSKKIMPNHIKNFMIECTSLKYLDIIYCDGFPEIPFNNFPHIQKPAYKQFYQI